MSKERIKYLLNKKASSPVFDKIFGIGNTGILPYLLTKAPTAAERKRMLAEENDGFSTLAPFVADWRLSRARKSLAAEKGGGKGLAKPISEGIGPGIATLLWTGAGAGIGAGIGALVGDKGADAKGDTAGDTIGGKAGDALKSTSRVGLGATIGAVGGFGLSMLGEGVGALAALIGRRRTEKEQTKYETSGGRTAMNYLLPGAATYNQYKNIGYLQGEKELMDALKSKKYMADVDAEFDEAQAEESEQYARKKKSKKKDKDKKDEKDQ
jgi:hypothetical protein